MGSKQEEEDDNIQLKNDLNIENQSDLIKDKDTSFELTLVPSIFERSPKNNETEISLNNTSEILGCRD